MKVVLVSKSGHAHTGIGRYSRTLLDSLTRSSIEVESVSTSIPPLPEPVYRVLLRAGLDAKAFLSHFPAWIQYPDGDLYHLTGQNLASLLVTRRPNQPVVVTVHDIIPYLLRDDPNLSVYKTSAERHVDRLALRALHRAHAVIADSEFTRQSIVERLGIPYSRCNVIYPGIDHQRFRPLVVPEWVYERHGLRSDKRYLIYVGSEDPRKNLPVLVEALAVIRQSHPDVELIKVGRAQFNAERQRLKKLAIKHGVDASIRFLEDVPDDDLALLYNLATVCVFPSLYEGFGFPVLEAMACGTPVVSSSATSLAEVVNGAGMTFDPAYRALESIVDSVIAILNDTGLVEDLSGKGMQHARTFTWNAYVDKLLAVYSTVLPSATNERSSVVA